MTTTPTKWLVFYFIVAVALLIVAAALAAHAYDDSPLLREVVAAHEPYRAGHARYVARRKYIAPMVVGRDPNPDLDQEDLRILATLLAEQPDPPEVTRLRLMGWISGAVLRFLEGGRRRRRR